MNNLKDENYKKLSDGELINIKHSKEGWCEEHKKAVYELHRRQKISEDENKKSQNSIKKMTFWILLLTIFLLILGSTQLYMWIFGSIEKFK